MSNVKIKVLDVPGYNPNERALIRWDIALGCLAVSLYTELQYRRIPEQREDCRGLESDESGGQTGVVESVAAVLR